MKLRKNKKVNNEFEEIQYMSNGNLYDTHKRLEAQINIDKNNISEKDVRKELLASLEAFSNKYTLDDYWLLLLHSNYFCNTIIFECNKWDIRSKIIDVVRYSWLNGLSGLYFDIYTKKVYPIIINNIEYNIYGEIVKIEYWNAFINKNINFDEITKKDKLIIEGVDKCKNVAVMRWGAFAISAWIMYYPFVRYQGLLLKMVLAQTFSFNKKYTYRAKNKEVIKDEMEAWFNPLNVFFLTLDDDFVSRFKMVENSTDGAVDFITFYKEAIGIYYAMFGRRMNLDFKRERNTVEEVSLTSGAIENIERDWLIQFEIFVDNLKEINDRVKLVDGLEITNIALNSWNKEKREQGIFDEGGDKNDFSRTDE